MGELCVDIVAYAPREVSPPSASALALKLVALGADQRDQRPRRAAGVHLVLFVRASAVSGL